MTRRMFAAAALFALLVFPARAGGIDIAGFDDPAQERRYADLIRELRCLVCQNQTLADSNADLAQDMRAAVREMVQDGASREEVVGFMTDRYGDFVRYRPRLDLGTLPLWIGPFLLAIAGLAAALILSRQRRRGKAVLDEEQRARAARLLK